MVTWRLFSRMVTMCLVSKSWAIKASFPLFRLNSSQLKTFGNFVKSWGNWNWASFLCTTETEMCSLLAIEELVMFSVCSWVTFSQIGCEIWQFFLTRGVSETVTFWQDLHWNRRFLSSRRVGNPWQSKIGIFDGIWKSYLIHFSWQWGLLGLSSSSFALISRWVWCFKTNRILMFLSLIPISSVVWSSLFYF